MICWLCTLWLLQFYWLVHLHPKSPSWLEIFSQPIRQLGHHVVEFPFIQIFRLFRPPGPLSHRWCLKPFCILLSDLIIPRAPPGIVAVHRKGTQNRHRGSYNGRCTEAPSSPKWPLSCRPRGSGTWYLCRFWAEFSTGYATTISKLWYPPISPNASCYSRCSYR